MASIHRLLSISAALAIGIFSDWPATTTYYANCMGLDDDDDDDRH